MRHRKLFSRIEESEIDHLPDCESFWYHPLRSPSLRFMLMPVFKASKCANPPGIR